MPKHDPDPADRLNHFAGKLGLRLVQRATDAEREVALAKLNRRRSSSQSDDEPGSSATVG
ncbi:hypothetical protein [Sphingomonas bacterium]|uniref:hypothetical protein n=1 Tax=Sphingomonas bacterium TaxID=1895847 RepID=UPI001576F531|nr:hypothetical protein [Sphingomonas bacterium]